MTTAVDTCILLDLLLQEQGRHEAAKAGLRRAAAAGALIVGEVVYAELMPQFRDAQELDRVLAMAEIRFVPSSSASAAAAGQAWRSYRRRGGPRERLIADFLVGGHALVHADCLLTRDRRFYKACFSDLEVVAP